MKAQEKSKVTAKTIYFILTDWTINHPSGVVITFTDNTEDYEYCDTVSEFQQFIDKHKDAFTSETVVKVEFDSRDFDFDITSVINDILEYYKNVIQKEE